MNLTTKTNTRVRRATLLAAVMASIYGSASGCRDSTGGGDGGEPLPAGPRRIVALGRLEPAGGVISISAIPGERLESYAPGVEEGARVAAGSVLAELASYDLRNQQYLALVEKQRLSEKKRQLERASAEAQRDQAEAALAGAEAKLEEVRSQQEMLDALAEAAAIASEDYRLLSDLQARDPELVTPHQLRKQFNVTDQARKDYEAANANLPSALAAAAQSRDAALANFELAKKRVEMLDELDESKVVAMEVAAAKITRDGSQLRAPGQPGDPTEFTVLKKFIQPGEFVAQMPVLQIADLSKMACVAEVYEADVKELAVGGRATIESAAFHEAFAAGLHGTIQRIGALVASPGLTNRNPLAPSDRSVVEVVVSIDDQAPAGASHTATQEAAARVGLQVTVKFAPNADSGSGRGGSTDATANE